MTPQLTLNLGLRYELDSNVKNISGYADTNPIVADFYEGDRGRDLDNFGPAPGLRLDQQARHVPAPRRLRPLLRPRHAPDHLARARTRRPRAADRGARRQRLLPRPRDRQRCRRSRRPSPIPSPASSCRARAPRGINIIDNTLREPDGAAVQPGHPLRVPGDAVLRVDCCTTAARNFIIGRTIGEVFNPVVGGPDRVVNLESSVGTRYDALLASLEKRWGAGQQVRVSYSLARARNYANDDQIPFGTGPIDPNDLEREYGPTPNEQRHRLVLSGSFDAPPRAAALGHLDDRFRRADGHPDARRLEPRAHAVAQRRGARVRDRRPSSTPTSRG